MARWTLGVVCLTFGACVPSVRGTLDVETDASVDSGTSSTDTGGASDVIVPGGTLTDGALNVTWAVTDSWDGGNCTEIRVRTLGEDVEGWSATVTLDQAVTAVNFEGIQLSLSGTEVAISPTDDRPLRSDEQIVSSYCIEPDARPVALAASGTTTEAEEVVEEEAEDIVLGTVVDDAQVMGLRFEVDGEENGGECLAIDVVNLSADTLSNWQVRATMSSTYGLTATSGLNFFSDTPGELLILPDANSQTIDPYDDERGRVCFSSLVSPQSLVTSYETGD